MNKTFRSLLFSIIGLLSFTSCEVENYKIIDLGFGKTRFSEPFIYLLKSRPNILEKSLEYPPYSWLTPDTISSQKIIEVNVNDEFLRGKAEAKFYILDNNGQPYKNIKFFINNTAIEDYVFRTSQEKNILTITSIVDPSVGDRDFEGYFIVSSKEVDTINGIESNNEKFHVMNWELKHEISIHWPLWIAWYMSVVIIILIVIAILYIIKKALLLVFSKINITAKTKSFQVQKAHNSKQKEKQKQKKESTKLDPYLEKRQSVLLSPTTLRDKAIAMTEAFQYFNYNLDKNNHREEQFRLLNKDLQNAFEDLWKKFFLAPKNNGYWTGEEKNSIWIPDDNFTPKNKTYNNIHNKSWKQIKHENKFSGLRFERGKPLFKEIAANTVLCNKFEKYLSYNDYKERSFLHNEAFEILAKQLNKTFAEVQKYKEENNYVWHEDHDCCTIYLVPREIHDNINHFGGIGMLQILRENNFISK